ncbi:MAG: TfoX/Sxy family protein [Gaiellales bacterium]|nr:TfoX/Sxy family protein [Gaiellales bacterium]
MAYDKELDARVGDVAMAWGASRRRMFGGTGYMLNGNMMAGVFGDSLILRLGPEEGAAALERADVQPFDISPNPHSGWVMVGPGGLDDDSLEHWLEQAREFVETLPEK